MTPRLDSLDEQIKKLESMMKSPKVSPKSLTPRFDNAEKQLDNLERIIKKDKRATDQERRFAELESDWKRQKSRAKTAKLARKFDALETAWNKQKATARKNTTKNHVEEKHVETNVYIDNVAVLTTQMTHTGADHPTSSC